MIKKEALSSDLNFIKEVEQLKIKQKLLIESLKRKDSDEQNKLFLEINSKLDFLVNIFNEANKEDEKEEVKEGEENPFAPIFEKLDEMSENINKRFTAFEEKLTKIKVTSNEDTYKEEKPAEVKPEKTEVAPINEAPPVNEEPPAPEFESNVGEDKKEESKKKKKWF